MQFLENEVMMFEPKSFSFGEIKIKNLCLEVDNSIEVILKRKTNLQFSNADNF